MAGQGQPSSSAPKEGMELRLLRCFVAVAEEQNITRAAERLRMAQPPLSRYIQRLERELGVMLINHVSRPLALTDAGRHFYNHAIYILGQVDELQTMTKRLAHIERLLRIGFVPSTLYGDLTELLRRFRHVCPDIELSLIELPSIEQLVELKGRRLDVGFGRLMFQDAGVHSVVLRLEVLIVALPFDHPYARRRGPITLEDVAREPLILYPSRPRPSFADQVVAAFRDRDITPASIREVRELQVALGLVAAGLGNCIVPANIQRLKREDVIYRPLAPVITSPVIMSTPAGVERPEYDLLLNLVDSIYKESGITRPPKASAEVFRFGKRAPSTGGRLKGGR